MQIAGGHPFLPPRQDANAPDLYIPVMAFGTYLMLCSLAMAASKRWSPDSMYGLVSCLAVTAASAHQSADTEQRGSHNKAALAGGLLSAQADPLLSCWWWPGCCWPHVQTCSCGPKKQRCC